MKIDTDRMTHGKEVAKRLRGTGQGGIPWMVILDAQGKALINADGPEGNIGCPVQPQERAHFMEMVKTTRTKLTDGDLSTLSEELQKFADKIMTARRR
ncbi:MAG: hypothetical protein AAEJ47_01235 [Planctomycetota bacterium]